VSLIIDAAPLIALADRAHPLLPVIDRLLRQEPGSLVLPAPVSAEVDYIVHQRFGRPARTAFLTDLADARFLVECLEPAEYETVLRYDEQYADLNVGLADLSIVVLAHRFRTRRVLTFDERHFRALRPLDGGSFVLLPRDEA
jgi:predicted nucleic acid-binding protein